MALLRRNKRPVKRHPTKTNVDERIWGRYYNGPAPWAVGLFIALLIAVGVYLAFAKHIPFTGHGFELHAKFENAATLRTSSPVRIAGVNVGKVTEIEGDGDADDVTFTVNGDGQPIHADATLEIRPRLFLEGNFFLDLEPGSPQSPELSSDGTIPVTQTATAVQIDEVLTALQQPQRKGLQKALDGFATGLTHEPTAAQDATQDPAVQGKTGAEALQQALRYGGPAGRDASIVNEALLGNGPHDLSGMIAALQTVFGKLSDHEGELQGLITNFNVTASALADEADNLSETIAELPPTLETAQPSLAHLSDALPPLRALAIELTPSISELPGTIDAAEPWLDQARPLITDAELGGLAKLLASAAPPLAETTVAARGLFDETDAFSRCVSHNLIPAGDVAIDNAGGTYPLASGVPNYQEFLSMLVNQAGAGQSFDGNGSWLRVNAGGGSVLSSTPYPPGGLRNDILYGNTQAAPQGTRPSFTAATPPYRPDVTCASNPLPDINGTGGVGLPGDVGAPSPEAVP